VCFFIFKRRRKVYSRKEEERKRIWSLKNKSRECEMEGKKEKERRTLCKIRRSIKMSKIPYGFIRDWIRKLHKWVVVEEWACFIYKETFLPFLYNFLFSLLSFFRDYTKLNELRSQIIIALYKTHSACMLKYILHCTRPYRLTRGSVTCRRTIIYLDQN